MRTRAVVLDRAQPVATVASEVGGSAKRSAARFKPYQRSHAMNLARSSSVMVSPFSEHMLTSPFYTLPRVVGRGVANFFVDLHVSRETTANLTCTCHVKCPRKRWPSDDGLLLVAECKPHC